MPVNTRSSFPSSLLSDVPPEIVELLIHDITTQYLLLSEIFPSVRRKIASLLLRCITVRGKQVSWSRNVTIRSSSGTKQILPAVCQRRERVGGGFWKKPKPPETMIYSATEDGRCGCVWRAGGGFSDANIKLGYDLTFVICHIYIHLFLWRGAWW